MISDVTLECDSCDNKYKHNQIDYYQCSKCITDEIIQTIKNAMEEIVKHKLWVDEGEDPFFVDFENKKEKDFFLRGIKFGINSALYSIADYFIEIESDFVENLFENDKGM